MGPHAYYGKSSEISGGRKPIRKQTRKFTLKKAIKWTSGSGGVWANPQFFSHNIIS